MFRSLVRFICIAFALAPATTWAQTSEASITGRVADPSDAPVAGVPVTVTNEDTGTLRNTVTSGTGDYTVPFLIPGRYNVSVTAPGFKKSTQAGITLQVDQVAKVDFALEIGAASESVEVKGETLMLDFETSSLGLVVENRQVTELPTNGRNSLAFLDLTPGVRMQGQAGVNENTISVQGRGNFSLNGGLADANDVLVDGAPVTAGRANIVTFIPPIDATEEFKVETNNYSAEYGRSAGGVVNMSIKSGTNQLHGTVYEFLRNRDMDANLFFQNEAGLGRPALTYNQYGASLGAPIIKNKLFVFANFEGFNQAQGTALTTTVPTPLQKQGNFSQTYTAAGQLISIYDPNTTVLGANGVYTRQPFPGNVIPASEINPVGQKFTNFFWPNPTGPGQPFTYVNNFSDSANQPITTDQGVARADYVLNSAWKLFGTYEQHIINRGKLNLFGNDTAPLTAAYTESQNDNDVVLAATGVLTPKLIAELRTSFFRFGHHRYPPNYPFDLTSLGFPESLQQGEAIQGFPGVTITGLQGASAVGGSTILSTSNNWTESGTLTWVHGSQTMKYGGQYRLMQENDVNFNAAPQFAFTPQFTSSNPLAATATSGVAMASLLLGDAATGTLSYSFPLADQRWYADVFFQDDWKVTKRLTLNLGLQYSLDSSITERFNRVSWFDPTATPPIASQVGLPLTGALQFGSPKQRTPEQLYTRQWAPRVGFAFQAAKKTVVRGGFGIFWIPFNIDAISTGVGASAWSSTTTMVTSLNGGITPYNTLSNPYPNGVLLPPGSSQGLNSLIGQALSVYRQSDHTGYVQTWNFDVQQEVWKNVIVDAAYAGSKSTGLPLAVDLNQLPNQYLSMGTALTQQVANPFYGLVGNGILASSTVARGQLLRPYPQFGSVLAQNSNSGSADFHSLQVKVTKQFSSSVILAAYTYSKTMGDSESYPSVSQEAASQPGTGLLSNNYNHNQDKSLAEFDAPQRLVLSYTVDLPFGKGKRFLNNGGLVNRFAGGWQLTGIYTAQSGNPLFLSTSTNLLASAYVSFTRPNNDGQSAYLGGSATSRLNKWFNTSDFSNPAAFTYGNTGRTLPDVRTQGIDNLDAGFFKNNPIHEGRLNLQFRAELFNIFNRVQFSYPGQAFGSAQFGIVSAQANSSRQTQMALKLIF